MSNQTENGHGLPARHCSAYPSETKTFKRLSERIEHDIRYWTVLRDSMSPQPQKEILLGMIQSAQDYLPEAHKVEERADALRHAIAGEEWCPMCSGGVGDGGVHESHCLLANPLTFAREYLIVPNVPDEVSLLASGVAPAREAEKAGGMTEVPQAQGLAPSACSHFSSIENACSEEDGRRESTLPQDLPGWPPAEPPEHGCGWPPSSQPHPIDHGKECGSESSRTSQCNMAPTEPQQYQ